jgi:hypothetical protein
MVKPRQRWRYQFGSSWFIVEVIKVGGGYTILAKIVQASHPTRTVGEVCDNLSLVTDGPDYQVAVGGADWTLLVGQDAPKE